MRGNQGTRGASPSRERVAREETTTYRDELGRGDREHLDRCGCAFPSRSDDATTVWCVSDEEE